MIKKILDSEGVRVYKRESKESPIKELRGTLVINENIVNILSVVLDYKNFKSWQPNLLRFERIRQINQREFIDYAAFKLPFPVQNRDAVFKARIIVDNKNKWLHVKIRETRHRSKPVNKNFIRIPRGRAKWSLKSIRGGKATWVEFTGQADPGGSIPNWLVNWLGKYRVVDSINRLKKRLKQKKFNQQIIGQYKDLQKW